MKIPDSYLCTGCSNKSLGDDGKMMVCLQRQQIVIIKFWV